MLKCLRISNLILVELIEVPFEKGFHVITGETGAGKSALLHALNLLRGEKADLSLIRSGETKGVVEAAFDIDQLPHVLRLLRDGGIDHEESEELLIRREINVTGKGRLFVNNQLAPLSLLREIGQLLFNLVSQQANRQLLELDQHRELLDSYGELLTQREQYALNYREELRLQKALKALVESEGERLRQIEICLMELEELEEAALKEGEDEELFQEYSLLVHAEERVQKSSTLYRLLTEGKHAVIEQLKRNKGLFEQLSAIDTTLEENLHSYTSALLELEEIAYTLSRYMHRIDASPERLAGLNERLSKLNKLKRKYGGSIEAAMLYTASCREHLKTLESSEAHIEELKRQIESQAVITQQLVLELTQARQRVAIQLQEAMTHELRTLNMPHATFEVRLSLAPRTSAGEDSVEFFLIPNIGERAIPVRNCASGGEVARVMLSLQTLLVGKRDHQTLLLDEIDANIGGETASVIGKKLREIGQGQQLICITHFPQVAQQAHHHLKIAKRQHNGRTFTQLELLTQTHLKQAELQRMRGG